MIIYSIMVLCAFLSCIMGPIVFIISIDEPSQEKHTKHHFLKG